MRGIREKGKLQRSYFHSWKGRALYHPAHKPPAPADAESQIYSTWEVVGFPAAFYRLGERKKGEKSSGIKGIVTQSLVVTNQMQIKMVGICFLCRFRFIFFENYAAESAESVDSPGI